MEVVEQDFRLADLLSMVVFVANFDYPYLKYSRKIKKCQQIVNLF